MQIIFVIIHYSWEIISRTSTFQVVADDIIKPTQNLIDFFLNYPSSILQRFSTVNSYQVICIPKLSHLSRSGNNRPLPPSKFSLNVRGEQIILKFPALFSLRQNDVQLIVSVALFFSFPHLIVFLWNPPP